MSKDVVALTIDDISQFTKRLRAGLSSPPGHVEMLGIVARAAGFRNYQHLLIRHAPQPAADDRLVARAVRQFDADGRLSRWPARTHMQSLCLWVIWAQLPARAVMTERQISARIDGLAAFRDAAQIRRGLVENRQVVRARDGSDYRRVEQQPPPEAKALIRRVLHPA